MKLGGRIWPGVLALCAVILCGLLWRHSRQQRRQWEEGRLAAAFSGDAAAFEELRTAAGARAVPLMEDFIRQHHRVDASSIENAVSNLACPDEPTRRLALACLTLLPERAVDLLKSCQDRATNSAARDALKSLILNRARIQKQVGGFMTGLYSEHFHRLFTARHSALQRNCQHEPAQLFFAYAPFDQVWTMLKNGAPELQLRFLLLRLYVERDDGALELLERFPAGDLLRVASQTWWPVELEPPARDGAYRWTTRAASAGKSPLHVLRISVTGPDKPESAGEWLHLDRWFRWTYLFRYREPILNMEAVVFAEGGVRKQNQGWRKRPDAHRERSEGRFWLPERPDSEIIGPGRCETVRGVPAGLPLAVAAITKPEELRWHGGAAFEWARPLFPEPVRSRVYFSPNEFPEPKVFSDTQSAAREGLKPRSRRPR